MGKIFLVSSASFRNKYELLYSIRKQAINASFMYIDQEVHIIWLMIGTSKIMYVSCECSH